AAGRCRLAKDAGAVAAAAETVVAIAVHARRPDPRLAVGHARDQVDPVLESAVLGDQAEVEVAVARTDQGIGAEQAEDFRGAVRAELRELLAQFVFRSE